MTVSEQMAIIKRGALEILLEKELQDKKSQGKNSK